MKEATLHTDALDLAGWLLGRFSQPDPLSDRVCRRALDLTESVALALQGLDRRGSLELADQALASLRVLLRLAYGLGRLDERQVLHAHERLDGIGRQIGGWTRRLDGDTARACRR